MRLPNGSGIFIASAYGSTKIMSAITNAAEAVGTLEASHGVVANDIVEVTSGWSRLDKRIVRAKSITTNDATFEGIKTTDTTKYAVGGGIGSVREISAWQQIIGVVDANTSGGETQYWNYKYLEDDQEKQLPTGKSAMGFTLNIADDTSKPHYAILDDADEDKQLRAIKLALPGNSFIYYNVIVSMNKTPSLVKDQGMVLQVSFSLQAPVTRY